ncbi:MAG: phage holin family protein [Propionibacteriaceae bacterium]|nr:phage holin family protein [Propionibacteriaceae bacterium]
MADQNNVGEIIKNVKADITAIVRGEVALAKAELLPQLKATGVGVGLFGGAGYLAFSASILLFIAAGFGISALYLTLGLQLLVALLLGFVSIAVLLLLVAAILAVLGKNKIGVTPPTQTKESVSQSVETMRSAVGTSTKAIGSKPAANHTQIALQESLEP